MHSDHRSTNAPHQRGVPPRAPDGPPTKRGSPAVGRARHPYPAPNYGGTLATDTESSESKSSCKYVFIILTVVALLAVGAYFFFAGSPEPVGISQARSSTPRPKARPPSDPDSEEPEPQIKPDGPDGGSSQDESEKKPALKPEKSESKDSSKEEANAKKKPPKDAKKPDFEGYIYVAEIQGRKNTKWTSTMRKFFKQRLVKIQDGKLLVEEDGKLSPKNITRYGKSKDNNRISLMLKGDTRLWFHCLNLDDDSYNPNCVKMLKILLKKTDLKKDQKKDEMDTKIDNMETTNQNKVRRAPKAKANQETENQKRLVFNVRCAKAKKLKRNMKFEKKDVEIKVHPLGQKPPQFLINGTVRTVKSFGTWKSRIKKRRFRISIEFSDKPKIMWFSLTNESGDYDSECVQMLRTAHKVFPKLSTRSFGKTLSTRSYRNFSESDLESWIKTLKGKIDKSAQNGASNDDGESPDEGRRRLTSRYDNHFPPFVRTCQEILDALDDAGVDY